MTVTRTKSRWAGTPRRKRGWKVEPTYNRMAAMIWRQKERTTSGKMERRVGWENGDSQKTKGTWPHMGETFAQQWGNTCRRRRWWWWEHCLRGTKAKTGHIASMTAVKFQDCLKKSIAIFPNKIDWFISLVWCAVSLFLGQQAIWGDSFTWRLWSTVITVRTSYRKRNRRKIGCLLFLKRGTHKEYESLVSGRLGPVWSKTNFLFNFLFGYETMSNCSQNCWIDWNAAVLCSKQIFHIGIWTFARFVRPLLATVWEMWYGSKNRVCMYNVFHWLAKKRLLPNNVSPYRYLNC